MTPLKSADANFSPSGDQAVQRTWCLWPRHTWRGVAVSGSQNRTVVSPPPLARLLPSGLKETWSTASVWPAAGRQKGGGGGGGGAARAADRAWNPCSG